jgi:hypothetical protein
MTPAPAHRPTRFVLRGFVAGAAAAGLAAGCTGDAGEGSTADAVAWFREEARARGLDFAHDSGARPERYLMPENMCGGAALFDGDGDGDLDAYLVQAGDLEADPATRPGNALFANDGAGRFTDVSTGSGADDRGCGMGIACGDADGDGRIDLYVTNTGPNVLLLNAGDLRFRDVTAEAGVGDPGFGASAAFVDYDHDGDLDLFTLNYIHWSIPGELSCFNSLGSPDYCSPQTYDAPARDVLYRNRGDGTFDDVTAAAGLGVSFGCGLGIAAADFDADGWIDLFVANDGTPDQLWHNLGDGTFVDEALFAGCAVDQDGRPKAGMGVTVGDVDEDGDPDLLVCNLAAQTDSFFRNEKGRFRDSTAIAGLGLVSRPYTRFGMAWVDLDQDGRLDLFQANGRVNRQSRTFSDDPYAEPNLVLRGTGNLRFAEVLPRGGTLPELVATSRAAAFGDVDGDGAVDVLVVNRDGPAHLLINAVPVRGNAMLLRVLERSGADALGAQVALRVGERRAVHDVRAAYSYQASNDPRVHVGLGDATRVEDVVVTWVGGTREAFGGFDAGATAVLRRGEGAEL